jgi:hypothetical protein
VRNMSDSGSKCGGRRGAIDAHFLGWAGRMFLTGVPLEILVGRELRGKRNSQYAG